MPATVEAGVYAAVDMGVLPGGTASGANGLNDNGVVVGYSEVSLGIGHAIRWTKAGGMTDLGTLGSGTKSSANKINSAGQIIGQASTGPCSPACTYHAFSWTSPGPKVDLGTLPTGATTESHDINSSGQVVGYAFTGPNCCAGHGFSWTQLGGLEDMGTLGGAESNAHDVADTGEVVGSSKIDALTDHATYWYAGGPLHDLGTLPGGSGSVALLVNEDGDIAGSSGTGSGQNHAFFKPSGGAMIDIGTLGGTMSRPIAMNEDGDVVGYSTTATGKQRAFYWNQTDGMTNLGVLSGTTASQATDINDAGQVVGFSGDHAFTWTTGGGMVALPGLGGTQTHAYAINNAGQIVGDGTKSTGKFRAVFWEPAAVSYRPDGRIAVGSGSYIGNNIYNNSGASQSKTASGAIGVTLVFNVSIQNDGNVVDSFHVGITSPPPNVMYIVTYFHGTTNISSGVAGGTFNTPSLAPGTAYVIKVKVTVNSPATQGSSTYRSVGIQSFGNSAQYDVVILTAKRAP